MFFRVHDDVDESVPHLARRGQRPGVEAITPNLSRASQDAIDGPRETDRHAHESPREGALVVSFHEQVQMVLLHGVMNDAKPRSGRSPQRATDLLEHEIFAKAR